MQASRRLLGPGQEIVVYKNNSDGKGNSYGCHENYLVDRQRARSSTSCATCSRGS